MSEPLPPTPQGPEGASPTSPEGALQASEREARDIGLAALSRLSGVIRVGRSYQSGNQVLTQQLASLLHVLKPLLDQSGEAVLVALDNDLYLNGRRIPVREANLRFHRHVLDEFQRRQIAGLRVTAGVTMNEMSTFFRLFLQPDVYTGTDLLTECLAQGSDHILPAVGASTQSDTGFSVPLPPDNPRGAEDAEAIGLDSSGTDGASFEGDQGLASMGPRAPKGAVGKTFPAAIAGARSLLMTTSLQGNVELRHAKRVVQPLVDGAFASEPVVLGLSSLTHHDEYTYAHAVNVTLVAVTMGHFLEMDRRGLADLGVAALLHDVGKAVVGREIKNSLESFTPEERRLAERHPLEGVKVLARSTTLNRTTFRCMRVALEHHLGPEGGYPALPAGWRTSLLSRVVAAADCFVSLQMHRSTSGAFVTPYEALGMMLGPLKPSFHPALLWALVQTLGFYPPGQLVELDTGAKAVVLAPNLADLARPHVRPLFEADGRRFGPGEQPDLRPLPAERSVRRAIPGAEYPGAEAWAA